MSEASHGNMRSWDFRPAPGFSNAHLQTVVAGALPNLRKPRIRRERWELPDGDFADLDWLDNDADGSWVVLLPGIAGNLSSPYAARMLKSLGTAGYRAGLLNYRGFSGEPNRLVTAYHAGFTADLDLIARKLSRRFGSGAVVGFSMGANLLLKWLGETNAETAVSAAVAVSAPFSLAPVAEQLAAGRLRVYDRHITACLRRFTRRKSARIPPPFELADPRALHSLRDFDEHITAPLNGFASAEDYYERTSCLPRLATIAAPTLILNALDDPLIPRETLPEASDLSPSVTLEIARHGGHVGFLGRNRFGLPHFALSERIIHFLAQHPSPSDY
jgi:predicted alpha/beta-fold hydrolase